MGEGVTGVAANHGARAQRIPRSGLISSGGADCRTPDRNCGSDVVVQLPPRISRSPSTEMRSEPLIARLLQPVEPGAAVDASGARDIAPSASNDTAAIDDVLDVAAAGKMLRVGRNKLYEMVARNKIPHRRFGRCIRFSRAAIMRWLDSCSLQNAKERQ
jgi:excisionase family DNA binding protein